MRWLVEDAVMAGARRWLLTAIAALTALGALSLAGLVGSRSLAAWCFLMDLLCIYALVRVALLSRAAAGISDALGGDEQVLATAVGRHAGPSGLIRAGIVLAATGRGLVLFSAGIAGPSRKASMPYDEVKGFERGGEGQLGTLSVTAEAFSVRLAAVPVSQLVAMDDAVTERLGR